MTRSIRIVITAVTLALLPGPSLLAQEAGDSDDAAPAGRRPRVGLALSGGGARGLAHVGILQELESLRVPVDVVTGTSMGAIVGGLFATGLPPDSLAVVAARANWERLMSDTPPRDMLDPRRREEQRRYSIEMELGLSRRGLQLPAGLIAGQAIDLFLRRLTLPVAPIEEFARLPTPFATVATDLERDRPVVLDRGDLVRALRTSMAIPIVFSPVRIDTLLLVDGGVTINLPVELARSMGADVVIAVDASPRLRKGERLQTLLGMTEQLSTILARRDMDRQLALADIVITPDLEGFGPFDFTESDSIGARGERAARARSRELARWAVSPEEYAAWRRARTPPPLPARIDRVTVDAPPEIDRRRILARANLTSGDPLDPARLELAAQRVYGTGDFERVAYDLVREDDNTIAVLSAVPEPRGRNVLRLGARLITDSGGADLRTGIVTFTAAAAWIRRGWNARGGESRIEGRFGQENALSADWLQPLDFAGVWFAAPSAEASWSRQPLYLDEDLVAEYDVRRWGLALDAGRALGRTTELRVGVRRAWVEAEVEGSDLPSLPILDEDVAAFAIGLLVDRLDDATWPRRGIFASAEALFARDELGSDRSWDRLAIEAALFATRDETTGFVAAGLGSALGTDLPAYDEFRLGGLLSLSGFGPGELRGPYVGALRAGLYRRVVTIPPSYRGIYVGAWAEAAGGWAESDDIDLGDLDLAATLAAGVDTLFGSIVLAYGRAEGGRGRIMFGLGVPWVPPFGL